MPGEDLDHVPGREWNVKKMEKKGKGTKKRRRLRGRGRRKISSNKTRRIIRTRRQRRK